MYLYISMDEDIDRADSPVNLDSYLGYLDRMYIHWLGSGQYEIYNSIKGLYILGREATHQQVKSVVFGLIDNINKLEGAGD